MTWVRLEPDAPRHPKMMRAGFDGWCLYTLGICYSAHYLTDGLIVREALPALWPHAPAPKPRQLATIAAKLVDVGLWELDPAGWRIHDYLRYQPTKSEVLEQRHRAQLYHQAGGRARASMASRIAGRFSSMPTSSEPADHAGHHAGQQGSPKGIGATSMVTSMSTSTPPAPFSFSVSKEQTPLPPLPVDNSPEPLSNGSPPDALTSQPESTKPQQPTREEQLRTLAQFNGLTPEQLRDQAAQLAKSLSDKLKVGTKR